MSIPDVDLVGQNTAAQDAAEDAAFVKSFNEGRGITEHSDPVEPVEPVVADPVEPVEPKAADPVEPVEPKAGDPANPVDPAATVEKPKLFAGLTEEQMQAALARTGTMQASLDKMAGRIGQLMQQLEALRKNPPTTQSAQQSFNLKLEKLGAAFPEMADMLREDLQALNAPAAALAETPPSGITQEQLDVLLNERLSQTTQQLDEKIEMRVLSILHPDWLDVIKTPQFALWRDNVLGIEEGKKLMSSEDSAYISGKLNAFKEWRTASEAPAVQPVVVPDIVQKKTSRLTNAVLPVGGAPKPNTEAMTEEDGFLAGFRSDQLRSGRAA